MPVLVASCRSSLLHKRKPLKIDIQLDGPFPLTIDHVVVEPDRTAQKTDVFREIVVHSEAAASDKVFPAGIVGGKDPLVIFVAFLIFDFPKTVVIPHETPIVL